MLTSPTRRRHDGDQPTDTPAARVLLVDDDDQFRHWLSILVRRLGFAVETAVDGLDAISKLHVHAFDLVIADLEMPKMNGLDLIRVIRTTPSLMNQYAVMLTSHEDVRSKVDALTAGYDDFLTKSCTEVEVSAKVVAAQRVLTRHHMLTAAAREWQALANVDELTGVAARRTFFERANRLLEAKRPIGVAILDLNAFKVANDTYGHLAGDRILRDIGALFLRRTRLDDLIARFGGDEFVLLAADANVEDINGAAERLATEVAALRWVVNDATVQITASYGVAHSSLLPNATLDQLLDTADRDLYAKKWLLKNPGAPAHLYEYPGREQAAVVSMPANPTAAAEQPASARPGDS